MGLEATTIAYIGSALAAAGAGAQAYNTKKTADDQGRVAVQGIKAQQAKQREIDARLSDEVSNLEGSSPEDERQQSMDQFMQQLRASRDEAQGTPTVGSQRYGQDTAASQAGVQNYGQKVASILSRLQAAGEQRRNEGFSLNRAGSDVAGTAREAQGSDFLSRLRMANTQRNPWVDAAGQVAKGAGSGMVTYAGNMDPMAGLSEIDVTAQPVSAGLTPRRTYNFTDRTRPFGG
jgi:hypothetical protein